MSPRSSKPKKAKGPAAPPDIYVSLLYVSVGALCIGCILLWFELSAYEWKLPGM